MNTPMIIKGGAGPYETAAIMAAIDQLVAEEVASEAMHKRRLSATRWVMSSRTPTVVPERRATTALNTHAIDEAVR